MNDQAMRDKVAAVLSALEARELEQRIAPVKCDKNPEAPECQAVALYSVECTGSDCGVPLPTRYGIGF